MSKKCYKKEIPSNNDISFILKALELQAIMQLANCLRGNHRFNTFKISDVTL